MKLINSKISQLLALILFASSLFSIFLFQHQQKQIDHETNSVKSQLLTCKRKLSAQRKSTQAIETDVIPATREEVNKQLTLKKASTELFSILMTYNDQKTWLQRKEKASKMVTNDVLNDKLIFNSGKDNTGNSVVEGLSINSDFDYTKVDPMVSNGDSIDGIVHVHYTGGTDDDSVTQHTDEYKVSYNLADKKFTSVKFLGVED